MPSGSLSPSLSEELTPAQRAFCDAVLEFLERKKEQAHETDCGPSDFPVDRSVDLRELVEA
jgi:hypothetical protein